MGLRLAKDIPPYKLERVSVEGLFSLYDYEIPLESEKNVTIIFGSNGVGKTTILNMINAASKMDLHLLSECPFRVFRLTFREGTVLIEKSDEFLTFTFSGFPFLAESKSWRASLRDIKDGVYDLTKERFERIAEIIQRRVRGESVDELLDKRYEEHEFAAGYLRRFRCHYITAGRLQERTSSTARNLTRVEECSRELAGLAALESSAYIAKAEQLELTFLDRVLRGVDLQRDESTPVQLANRIKKVSEDVKTLVQVGLFPPRSTFPEVSAEFIRDNLTPIVHKLLETYVSDMETKTKILRELAEESQVFLDVVNRDLRDKQLRIEYRLGYGYGEESLLRSALAVFNINGQEIGLAKLSSGEQHRILWAYELAFKSQKNSLVLIDEPELSMHVAWQLGFVNIIRELGALNGLSFLLATHSPNIINGQWDLTVDLDEQSQGESRTTES